MMDIRSDVWDPEVAFEFKGKKIERGEVLMEEELISLNETGRL